MKRIFTVLFSLATVAAFAQSHEQGDLTINVDYEIGLGNNLGGSVDGEDIDDSINDDITTTQGHVRVDVQYGIAENISAGVVARIGTTSSEIDGFDASSDASVFNVGVEARYYILNQDAFNVFAGPEVGLNSVSPDEDDADTVSGLFWGIHAGGNYMFSDIIGANLRLGYGSKGTSEDQDFGTGEEVEVINTIGSFNVGFGLTLSF